MSHNRRFASLLLLLALLLASLPTYPSRAEGQWADPAFLQLWQRNDQPVATGQVQRSWTWGPGPGLVVQQLYNGKPITVQYSDKARMEIADPAGDRSSKWFVTSGLLVSEMVAGKVAGALPTALEQALPPAEIVVAGDATNQDAPTYASFQKRLVKVANRGGQPLTLLLDRQGGTVDLAMLARPVAVPTANLAYYEPATGHNIATPFWNFLNQRGKVYEAGRLVDAPLYDWQYVMGYPISEPYWVQTTIGGQPATVLVQLFERRTLTYLPTAAAGWQVQMGNVGQHYQDWLQALVNPRLPTIPASPPLASSDGFLHISGSGDQFTYGGQRVRLKGSNYFNSLNPWAMMWRRWDGFQVDAELSRISALGGNVVRISLPYDKDETRKLIWEDTRGRGDRINPEFIRRVREFLQIAAKYQLKVNISLFDWYDIAPAAGTPEEDANLVYLDSIVKALAGDDRVFAWDIHNEADNYDNWQQGRQAQVLDWEARMVARIRQRDPNHPIAVSMGDWRNLSYKPAGGQSALEISDFVALHGYDGGALAAQIDALKQLTGKPILLQEAGWPTGPAGRKNYDEATQSLFYSLAAEAASTRGIAGWLQWSLYDYVPGTSTPGTRGDHSNQAFEDYFGLLRTDSTEKPAAAIFRSYSTVGLPSKTQTNNPLTVAPKEEW